jgi:hypothetical protein
LNEDAPIFRPIQQIGIIRSSSAPAGSGNRVRRSFLRFTIERPHHADPRMQQKRRQLWNGSGLLG